MNVPLLEATKQFILGHPLQFDMGVFYDPNDSCGTVGCIGGWAVLIDDPDYGPHKLSKERYAFELYAAEKLGLDEHQYMRLFFVDSWPRELRDKYEDISEDIDFFEKAEHLEELKLIAELTAERIDAFIASNGES